MRPGPTLFRDRFDAGRQLAARLGHYAGRSDLVVLGLPRGGVPVAFEVARALGAPLDVFVVRKLGTPGQEELALGAIASGGTRVLNEDVVRVLHIAPQELATVTARERAELERRELAYRGNRPAVELAGRAVMLVDDGLATGASMRAAAASVTQRRPAWLVIAIPVAPSRTCAAMSALADEVVCVATPEPFQSVGTWYEEFRAPSDEEVRELLASSAGPARIEPE
jgi:putative phosphoribosyl transferase